jgi:dipeptidyl-peptidase-4
MRSALLRSFAVAAVAAGVHTTFAGAQTSARAPITVERIFKGSEFASAPLPTVTWLADGRSYLDLRPDAAGGTSLVRVDLATGAVTTMAAAAELVDGAGKRIDVEEVQLSADESKALLFHSSVRVWRSNTRGVFHVLDLKTKKLTPIATVTTPGTGASTTTDTVAAPFLGKNATTAAGSPDFIGRGLASGAADPALQMYAKFSPDGRQVAFVRGNNLWVTDLASGGARQLTTDGSDDVINGTTDWVYEEELGLSDAFRWSPDSRRIAYWRFDQSRVSAFPMVTETDAQYPVVSVLRYPKAGTPNSRVQVGVIDVAVSTAGAGAAPSTRWIDVGADTGIYIARMDWVGSDSLAVQRLPRRQNQVDVLMASAATGRTRLVLTDRDSAYVDVEDEGLRWIDGGRHFLWRSDRSGWRQLYLYDRSGRLVRQVTRDGADVLGVVDVDERRREVYVTAAAPTPTQRQVYRYPLDRSGAGRQVTRQPGTHALTIGPGARYAVDFHSTAARPTTVTLYELPAMTQRRVLVDNARLTQTLAASGARAPEFFQVPLPGGTRLDAMRFLPPDFSPARKYPVLMYVYGGPASPTVSDAWGGSRGLWHQSLAAQGYVVVSVDNRGAAWRGTRFRKITQHRLGQVESDDQIEAAKWLRAQPWVDAGRVGIWGWSYGGYLTTLTAARGGNLFKAAIAVAPVVDWSLYDTIYTERFMWTPQQNPEGYKKGAPLEYVEGITARFLLVHGTGDDNVHPQNSIQLADRLEAAGKPFYMLLYPNRTHSISGGNSSYHLFSSLSRVLKESL